MIFKRVTGFICCSLIGVSIIISSVFMFIDIFKNHSFIILPLPVMLFIFGIGLIIFGWYNPFGDE